MPMHYALSTICSLLFFGGQAHLMVSGKWLEIDGRWYYFYADGALARSTKVDGYEVGSVGARKTK